MQRTLSTAEVRREAVIAAAMEVFGARGYHAAPTMEIAKRAGISQAYLFRLFPTKVELFVACSDHACERMLATFTAAAHGAPDGGAALHAMGEAYGDLVRSERDVLMVQLHCQAAAAGEPAIRAAGRRSFERLHALVAERSGADADTLRRWFADGMLINAMAALAAEDVDAPWATALNIC